MARPLKQGIDYFPYDVDLDQDDKLAMIIGEFGEKGELIFIKILSWTYKHNGYYSKWNEMEQLKFAKRVSYIGGASVNLISEIVARCIKWGLFDKDVFDMFQILTSVRIQKTWLDASRKRKDRVVDENLWLLGDLTGLTSEETQETAEVIYKRKESKRNEIKGKEPAEETPPLINDKLLVPLLSEIFKKFNPTYIQQTGKDFKPLLEISKFLCSAEKIDFNLKDPTVIEKIKGNWEIISQFISQDNFYKTFNLISIEKNIQAIVQKIHHGSSKQSVTNISTQSAFDKIDQLTAKNGGR